MIARHTHVDTRRLTFDDALAQRLSDRTSPPDANGCMLYNKRWRNHIEVKDHDGRYLAISTLRVAFVFAGRGHLSEQEEATHVCRNTGIDGRPLCVCPDHLERTPRTEKISLLKRAARFARIRRTLPNYGRNA